jgi:hypothetical protein
MLFVPSNAPIQRRQHAFFAHMYGCVSLKSPAGSLFNNLCTPLHTSISISTSPPPTTKKSERFTSVSDRALRPAPAYDYTPKLMRVIGRIKADCRAPAPPAVPFRPSINQPTDKSAIFVCAAQWRAFLFAHGRA